MHFFACSHSGISSHVLNLRDGVNKSKLNPLAHWNWYHDFLGLDSQWRLWAWEWQYWHCPAESTKPVNSKSICFPSLILSLLYFTKSVQTAEIWLWPCQATAFVFPWPVWELALSSTALYHHHNWLKATNKAMFYENYAIRLIRLA